MCDFKDSCGDNSDEIPCGTSCTFEDDYCYKGWRNPTGSDNTDWIRQRGAPQSFQTGPKVDHTTGAGSVSQMIFFMHVKMHKLEQTCKEIVTNLELLLPSYLR